MRHSAPRLELATSGLLLAILLGSCGPGVEALGEPQADGNKSTTSDADSGIAASASTIKVALTFHIDPTDPSIYPQHRDAVVWLTQLAKEKGFAISAGMTGLYAELAVKQGHLEDFQDFMPGGKHLLGTHLHSHYKADKDQGKDFSWTEDGSHSAALAPRVFGDQIAFVNQVFTGLGHRSKDNRYFNGSHTSSDDMEASYGAKANTNSYDNTFDIIEGRRGVYHPYRSAAGMDVVSGREDLSAPFVAVGDVAGILGSDALHGPEGMVYGTLAFAQRDFILEYLEWVYYQRHKLGPRPWVFGFGFHPYEIVSGYKGTDGIEKRTTVRTMYEWLNEHFIGTVASHATQLEVAEEYKQWEKAHPKERLFPDTDERGAIKVQLRTQLIYDELRQGVMSLKNQYRTAELELYEFASQTNERRFVLLSASGEGSGRTVDLHEYVSRPVQVVSLDGKTVTQSATAVTLGADPVLLRPAL